MEGKERIQEEAERKARLEKKKALADPTSSSEAREALHNEPLYSKRAGFLHMGFRLTRKVGPDLGKATLSSPLISREGQKHFQPLRRKKDQDGKLQHPPHILYPQLKFKLGSVMAH